MAPARRGPFALLDTVYVAQSKVLSVAPTISFPPLRVFWSVDNVPAPGNPALGQIGTSSFISGASGRSIYVLGKQDVDTDEYDVGGRPRVGPLLSVGLQPGRFAGRRPCLTSLDRRVAFSEGWGNAWSGIALGRANYTDSLGGCRPGKQYRSEQRTLFQPGWYREGSIQAVFWNLNSQVGFKPIHDTLSGPFRTSIAVTSIHPFAAAFNGVAPASCAVLRVC